MAWRHVWMERSGGRAPIAPHGLIWKQRAIAFMDPLGPTHVIGGRWRLGAVGWGAKLENGLRDKTDLNSPLRTTCRLCEHGAAEFIPSELPK